ncbi:sigma factor-like helix-turn-helix DNA-binding protein [Pajaroellobacter abortibovis]
MIGEGLPLEEVGVIMSLTHEWIRQVEVKGLAKLGGHAAAPRGYG